MKIAIAFMSLIRCAMDKLASILSTNASSSTVYGVLLLDTVQYYTV